MWSCGLQYRFDNSCSFVPITEILDLWFEELIIWNVTTFTTKLKSINVRKLSNFHEMIFTFYCISSSGERNTSFGVLVRFRVCTFWNALCLFMFVIKTATARRRVTLFRQIINCKMQPIEFPRISVVVHRDHAHTTGIKVSFKKWIYACSDKILYM